VDLFAATGEPAAEGVSVTVEGIEQAFIAPEPPASVPAGSPLLVFGETAGPGEGRLAIEVRRGRRVELHLTIGDAGLGETLRLMQGARLVTDLESRLDAAAPGVAKREQERIRKRLESLGSELGLANRRMALVAVVERAGDRPGEIPKTVVVPVGMPQDTDFGSYFQTAPLTSRLMKPARLTPARMPDLTVEACLADMAAPPPASRPKFKSGRRFASAMASYGPPEDDPLMDLIARLEPDGGMPGGSESERLLRSAAALLCLLAAGHSRSRGAFRMHVGRLMDYLRHSGLNDPRVAFALEMAERGKTPVGWPIQPQELMPERPLDAAAVCAAIDRMFPVA
jgi:hypothetical protein